MYIAFWIGITAVFYAYFGYGILLFVVNRLLRKRNRWPDETPYDDLPSLTLLVAAYNEATIIEQKIDNALMQHYPKEKLQIVVVTDGSTDESVHILGRFSQVKVLHDPVRKGKAAAINRAVSLLDTEVVVFSDANTLLNERALMYLAQHYADATVGGVSGEKKIASRRDSSASLGEGAYWKYESFLKKLDSDFYSLMGAAGELFSIRTALFEPVEEDTILDDFMISMRIVARGYKIKYEPRSLATEEPSFSLFEERKRKKRISAGAFQSMRRLPQMLNFFKRPLATFMYVSHRVLRWTLAPLSVFTLPLINLVLIFSRAAEFYRWSFFLQLSFYVLAFTGYLLKALNIKISVFFLPYYFLFMNASVVQGFARYLKGTQSAAWERSQRYVTSSS